MLVRTQERCDAVCLWMIECLRILRLARKGARERLSDALASMTGSEEMGERLSAVFDGSKLEDFPARVDVVAFLLAYSILDSVTLECCRMSFSEEPLKWEKEMSGLERQPLLKKLNLLFKKAGIRAPSRRENIEGYRYSWKRMKEINILRNLVAEIEESLDPQNSKLELPGSEKDMKYLERTCFFLIEAVASRYNLKIDNWLLRPLLQ